MRSKVYFIAVSQKDETEKVKDKLLRLLEESAVLDCIQEKDRVALKIHFGEQGNTGYVRPGYVRIICDAIGQRKADCFLCDTNTLYRGRRMTSSDHLQLAYEHGFTPQVVGAPVVIPDDTRKENVFEININQQFIKVAKIARIFQDVDMLLSVAHFKGHMMTGFGGAIKNIAMGCATREGKLAQHSDLSPFVKAKRCVGCQACVKACPVDAISMRKVHLPIIFKEKAEIDGEKCISCASCIAACKYSAIDVDWDAGGKIIQEKMAEYAKAVLQDKEKRGFLNFATKITKECDCLAKDDPRIAPDVGIFASSDPVSIDKASFDLVNSIAGKDVFKKAHPDVDGMQQLDYAASLGVGNLDYELVQIK